MRRYQVGDKVRRIYWGNGCAAKVGQMAEVVTDDGSGLIGVRYDGMVGDRDNKAVESWARSCTELVSKADDNSTDRGGTKIMTPHKHRDLIIAWANGAQIQHKHGISASWVDNDNPSWLRGCEYRIKPKTVKYKRFVCRFGDSPEVLVVSPVSQADDPRETWNSFVRWIDNDWQEAEI